MNNKKTEIKEFYFTFYQNKLFYYKDSSKNKVLGLISLFNCYIKREGIVRVNKLNYFLIKIYHNCNHESLFCRNEEEYENWVEKLNLFKDEHTFSDKYQIKEFLGQGKHSIVHKCIEIDTSHIYAVKILRKTKMDKIDLETTRREIAILKYCNHPKVIKIFSTYETFE